MNTEKPLILVCNDDGITAPGIKNLVDAIKHLGQVVIVAPDSPQSAMGHAVTISKPLRLDKTHLYGDIEAWQCSGTPADCVKLAVD
jgi:5'-nucleotidase